MSYKVVVRYVDSEEGLNSFDLLDEVLDYLSTNMGHVLEEKTIS